MIIPNTITTNEISADQVQQNGAMATGNGLSHHGGRSEVVSGEELLDELTGILNRHVILPEWGAETLALWIAHTYAFELRDITAYIGIESPEKRCGKTTLLGIL